MQSWVSMLRSKAEDAYYRRSSWEALATVFLALIFGIILCWLLTHY